MYKVHRAAARVTLGPKCFFFLQSHIRSVHLFFARETVGAHFPVADIPSIDLKKLSSLSSERDEELKNLKLALNSWGCFQAVNHGMGISLMEMTREATKSFFATDKEEKHKYARPDNDIEGYGNDMIFAEEQILDWTDRLYLTVMPFSERKLQYWPQNPPNFRDVLDEFAKASEQIGEVVFKALAVSLGLDEHCFLEMYGKSPKMNARFNFYPPCNTTISLCIDVMITSFFTDARN
ncbi:unnamed protein product [Rhodiola kirilowii]